MSKVGTADDDKNKSDVELGTAYELDPGLSDNVQEQVETPQALLRRILIDDESILQTFDVKFPGEFVPLWQIVSLLIVTAGLYGIVLLFRMIRRWCYRNKCCTPATVSFVFGKMAITSKGRIICWKELVYQMKPPQKTYSGCVILCYLDKCVVLFLWSIVKLFIIAICPDLCGPPTEYEYSSELRSYRVADIKQITQYMTSEANCIFCCLDYVAGVEVSFNSFNHGSNHLQVASKSSEAEIGTEAQVSATSATKSSYYSWAKGIYGSATNILGKIERSVGIAPNLNTIFIVANTGDRVHNGDVESILKDVNSLHKKILNYLPPLKDAIVVENIDTTKFKMQGDADISFTAKQVSTVNYKYTDKFKNVTIVGNKGEIEIPSDWMPLLENEYVVATNGQVKEMKFFEWIWTYLSLGIAYCLYYRRRKYTRSALVLTNKRLISVDIYERSGTIPLTLSNFSVQVRSFILDNVHSGFISSQNKHHLEAGIECDGGALFINFSGNGRSSFPFAYALQMSAKRKVSAVKSDLSKAGQSFKVENYPSIKFDLLPLLTGESYVNVVKGNHRWEPFGTGMWARLCNYLRSLVNGSSLSGGLGIGCCCNKQVDQMCSKQACNEECCCAGQGETPFFFPVLPYIVTCALRPFQYETSIVITNMSIIRIATQGNYGFCGFLRFCGLLKEGPCVTNDSIMISWETLDSFSGFNLYIKGAGKENVTRRCCRSNCIGRTFCPIGVSSAEFAIDFKGNYSFNTQKIEANKAWIKDEELNSTLGTLTRLQIAIQDHVMEEARKKDPGSSVVVSKMERL